MNPELYKRPPGMRRVVCKKRERHDSRKFEESLQEAPAPVIVHAETDCFVTPPEVAERMAVYLGACQGEKILEPSAGTGNLISAVINRGIDPGLITAVELNLSLCNTLRERFDGVTVNSCDFLEWSEETSERFEGIIMNPPFSKRRTAKHIAAALSLLDGFGRLIALVPCTYDHDEAETIEDLPPGTFSGTDVRTKIIQIDL